MVNSMKTFKELNTEYEQLCVDLSTLIDLNIVELSKKRIKEADRRGLFYAVFALHLHSLLKHVEQQVTQPNISLSQFEALNEVLAKTKLLVEGKLSVDDYFRYAATLNENDWMQKGLGIAALTCGFSAYLVGICGLIALPGLLGLGLYLAGIVTMLTLLIVGVGFLENQLRITNLYSPFAKKIDHLGLMKNYCDYADQTFFKQQIAAQAAGVDFNEEDITYRRMPN